MNKNSHHLVRDVMHRGVITCTMNTPLRQVIHDLEQHHLHALIVVDDDGNVAGVLSQTDLVRARAYKPDWGEWQDLPAARLMTPHSVVVKPEDSVQMAINLMSENLIHRLVVVEDGAHGGLRPVGILSMTDLVHEMAHTR